MKGYTIFVGVCCVGLIAFGIWYPATHESKAEKISRLEQQVDDLGRRVAILEGR